MAPPKRSCKKEASVRNRAKHSNGKRVYSVSIFALIIATSYRVVHHSDFNGNDASCKCSWFVLLRGMYGLTEPLIKREDVWRREMLKIY